LSSFLHGAGLTVVLGVGSELRGDDAAGILVARKLAESPFARASVRAGASAAERMAGARTGASPRLVALEGHTAPESLTGKIIKLRPSHVLVVDAAEIGGRPGEWAMLGAEELDASVTATHLIPLSKLAAYLTEKKGCVVGFVGIQPGSCGVAVGVSAPVGAAVEDVADNIVRALAQKRP
jgi:hydrogenase 3 maturation protease